MIIIIITALLPVMLPLLLIIISIPDARAASNITIYAFLFSSGSLHSVFGGRRERHTPKLVCCCSEMNSSSGNFFVCLTYWFTLSRTTIPNGSATVASSSLLICLK